LFIGTYERQEDGRYEIKRTAPLNAQKATFPELVAEVSPTFVLIFNQAMVAEAQELDQLVGIGLRKALEFLIKDYLIQETPGEADAIKKAMLGTCINNYVTDQNVKTCAERATWLGNDETHYTRKWETQDIQDLKRLVRLTTNWIDNALATKKYMAEMPEKK
jgi:hypothetical protein